MAKSTVPGLSFAIIASISAVALAGPAAAQASHVGVTSATDGDPLGKPPSDNERVLRIGIDVQANEVVTTHNDDRAHLVFLDGSSLTVGPNAQLTIDKFIYDPNSKTGELAITASKGLFRLVGGKISKTNAINIATPSGTIGIRGGITIFNVAPGSTTANFIFGHNMTVTGQGQTQNVTRPGSQVIVNSGTPPSLPSLLPPGGLTAAIKQLETGTTGGGGPTGNADQKAQTSGFSATNTGAPPPSGNPPNTNNPNIINTITNSGGASNPQDATKPPTTPLTTPAAMTNMTPKTSQTLQGFVGGLVVTSTGGYTSTTSHPLALTARPGDLTITTDAAHSTAQATIIIRNIDGTLTSPTATLPLGTTANSNFFQDNATYATGADGGTGTLKPIIGPSRSVGQTTFLTSSAATPDTAAPYVGPGTCTCNFLTFGEWQTTITDGRSTAVVTQAPWVAGTVAVQLPNTGSASFSGIMLGQAQNGGGPIRNVQGSYGMNYSWGAGLGSFNASFDSRSYTGAVAGTGGSNFAGAFVGGGNVGSLSGVFNSAPGAVAGSPPAGQSGTFGITGPSYLASGVFAGARH